MRNAIAEIGLEAKKVTCQTCGCGAAIGMDERAKLVSKNIPLATATAATYAPRFGLSTDDIRQIALMALVIISRRYDPSQIAAGLVVTCVRRRIEDAFRNARRRPQHWSRCVDFETYREVRQ